MEINHKWLKFVVFAIVAMLAACGSDTYYSGHYENIDDKFGKQPIATDTSAKENFNKSIAFEGKFNLVSVLEPVKLEITALDENFEKTQTVSARIERNRLDFTYKAPEIHFYRPYAQIDFTCRFRDTKDPTEMQFTILANLKENGFQNIDFYRTIESGYLKKLLKKNESYSFAKWHTRQAIHNLLDPELEYEYGIENAPYGADTLEALAYNYSLFFTWDSTFYKNFKKLLQAVGGSKKWDEILSVSEISETLTRHYKLEDSRCNKDSLEKVKQDRDFTQLRYNTATWIVQGKNPYSCETKSNSKLPDPPSSSSVVPKDTSTIDSVIEAFGKCTITRKYEKVMLSKGKYYSCDGTEWQGISAPEYFGDVCEGGEVVLYDNQYFMCFNTGYWNPIPEEKILPPVKAFEKCRSGRIVEVDKKFYRCTYVWDREWNEISKEEAEQYKKNGKFCTDSTAGITEKVNDEYFTCKYYSWNKLDNYEIEFYKHDTAHKDECKNGSKGTKIYWNDVTQVYFYCDHKSRKWDYTRFNGRDDYELDAFDKGIYLDSCTIQATKNEFTYTVNQVINWAGRFEIVNSTATMDSHTYGAKFIDKVPYLSSLRGDQTISLKSLTDKSDSFDDFMNQYAHLESAYPVYLMQLTHVDKDSYMNFEKAEKFCPKGYHLPDTSGLPENFLNVFGVDSTVNHDSPLYVRYNTKTYLYDIYWTSVSKDATTQYCLEIRKEDKDNPKSQIIECPKDLYPGVQTLCFKNGDEND